MTVTNGLSKIKGIPHFKSSTKLSYHSKVLSGVACATARRPDDAPACRPRVTKRIGLKKKWTTPSNIKEKTNFEIVPMFQWIPFMGKPWFPVDPLHLYGKVIIVHGKSPLKSAPSVHRIHMPTHKLSFQTLTASRLCRVDHLVQGGLQ